MYIDRHDIKEYPFFGKFVTFGIDDSKPLNEQVEEEIVVLETECDIQESSKTDNKGMITASFNVYFPFDKTKDFAVRRGMTFIGSMYGMEVNGNVIGVIPTQMGAVAYLADKDI